VAITFMLMFVILNVSTGAMEKGIMAGVAVGGMVALAALFAGPFTGASMNPARSLAPALVSGRLDGLWIYLVAPVAGAILAHPSCRVIQGPACCPPEDNSSQTLNSE
jgi:aquaporin Z